MGESDFNQFMRLKNQLVIATKNFGREQNFSPTQILAKSWDMNEQHKLTQMVLTLWLSQTERYAWLYCVTMWISQRLHMLKSEWGMRWLKLGWWGDMYKGRNRVYFRHCEIFGNFFRKDVFLLARPCGWFLQHGLILRPAETLWRLFWPNAMWKERSRI